MGANGQMLIFHLPKENKLVVVDVQAKKIVKEFDVAANVKFAANRKHLIIILPSQKLIQRWNLGDDAARSASAVLATRRHCIDGIQ